LRPARWWAGACAGWTGRPYCAPRWTGRSSARARIRPFQLSAHRPPVWRSSPPVPPAPRGRSAQVVDGLLVDVEHGGGGAIFGRHVGDGGAVADGQAARAIAKNSR
jgi:hypothetical protein